MLPSSRRSFFKGTSLLGLLGALPGGQRLAMAMAAKNTRNSMKVYTRLGLRPIVNASGTYTHLGGSLMPPEILDAMNDAARHYVPIRDLTKATGEQVAKLTGVPGALITTGAAGGIFVGTCACIAGDDPEKMKRLPFTEGMKNQIVLQKLHNTGWTRQCEAAGGRIVEVEEKDQMERAIGNQTAMIYFLIADKHFVQYRDRLDAPGGKVSLEECIKISKAAGVPILVDAVAEVPPFQSNASASTRPVHNRHDRRGRVALPAIVYVDVCRPAAFARPVDQRLQRRARLRVWILYLSVGGEQLDSLLVGSAAPEQRAADHKVRSERFRNSELPAQLRHARPGVEHVRHAVAAQAGEVLALEELRVANFHGVAKGSGKLRQERIEQRHKMATIGNDVLGECVEFENQRRDFLVVRFERPQERLAQQSEVQKGRVRHPALCAVPRVIGKQLARDLFGNLEGELKSRRRLAEQALPEVFAGELVESEIAA